MANLSELEKNLRLQITHAEDLINRAKRQQQAVYSKFFDPATQQRINALPYSQDCILQWFGGYSNAERQVLACHPSWMTPEELVFPIQVLNIHWDARFTQIGHRDLLGAILGLGLEREGVGDILVHAHYAQIFVLHSLAGYIQANLTQAGRASVRVETGDLDSIDAPVVDVDRLRVTVQSTRLDAVIAAVFHLSRTKAAHNIAAGLVQVNWLPDEKSDRILKIGDRIVLRGQGRACILHIGEPTRKGRVPVEVEKTKR